MELLLFTGDMPQDALNWVLVENGKSADLGNSESLEAFAKNFYDANAVPLKVVLPGERVASRLLDIPARHQTQLRQAASLALEDELAEPIDNLHVILAGEMVMEKHPHGKAVMALPEAWLQNWLDAFSQFDLDPEEMVIDFSILDGEEGKGTILIHDGRIIANLGGAGFAAERSFISNILPDVIQEADCSSLKTVHYGENSTLESDGGVLMLKTPRELADFYLQNLSGRTIPNILQGKFTPRTDWFALLRPWKTAALLLAICGISYLGLVGIEGMRMNVAAKNVTQQAEANFKKAYPGITIRNLTAQARSRLSDTDAAVAPQFLALTSALSKVADEVEGVEVYGLTYAADGALITDIRFDFDSLETLKSNLTAVGVRTEEGRSPRRDGEKYVGKLTLRAV